MSEELNYLKHIYFSLDISQLLKLQAETKINIPEKYRLVSCDYCKYTLAVEKCNFCEKNICEDCTIKCYRTKTVMCKNHGDFCKNCNNNECICESCRKPSRNICNKCILHTPTRKYSCQNCSSPDILTCKICGN